MSLINISNLTFAYEGSYDNVFTDVSFQLDTAWKLGFVGRNGRGKTTFLRLLMGEYEFKGNISSSVEFEYFPFKVENNEWLTIDIVDSICSNYEQWELNCELNLLEVSDDVLYRQFCTLSNGEQTKILLAILFLKPNRFLLIDEPTNHLDTRARQIVARYLNQKSGYILVSHDRKFIDSCVDHILSINKHDIEVQRGNFSTWLLNKERKDSFEITENEKLKHEIKKMTTAVKRTAEWSDVSEKRKIGFDPAATEKSKGRRPYLGAKAAKMMARSKTIEGRQQRAIEDKSKLLKNLDKADGLKLSPLQHYSSMIVEAIDIAVSYDGCTACKDISFTVERGARVVLQGRNGSGKSSILKLILGEDIQHLGTLRLASNLVVSYVSQETAHLQGNLLEFARDCEIDESQFMTILRKLDFSRVQFEKNIEDYSGGQKKKVLIAKSLCEKAHLYIWDEPLNFIDVLSRMQIEQLILEFSPTMLIVEHDSSFCENVATKTVEI